MTQTHLIVVIPLDQLAAARAVVATFDAPGAGDTFTVQLTDPSASSGTGPSAGSGTGPSATHAWASWQLLSAAGVAAWKAAKLPGVRLFDGALRLPEEILAELNLSSARVSNE